jgi:hypothetical protein
MIPIKFPQQNVTFAEDQPQYQPLPAYRSSEGEVISCWKLSFRERLKVLFGGRLWLRQYTFRALLQPQLPQVESPFVKGSKLKR